MDGQLGREKSASFPAPIKFSSVKTSVQDDGRKGGKFWSQADRDGDDKHSKVLIAARPPPSLSLPLKFCAETRIERIIFAQF